MSPITVFDDEHMTVEYLADKKIVYHTIHKPVGGQVFRDALMAGTAALKQYGACKWLSDDRKNGPLSPDDIEWGLHNWNIPTIKAGWKYWAVVVPEELIAAGSLTPTMEGLYALGLRMLAFSKLDEAIEWLDSLEC